LIRSSNILPAAKKEVKSINQKGLGLATETAPATARSSLKIPHLALAAVSRSENLTIRKTTKQKYQGDHRT
jgi:hypothetical protein